MTPVVRPRIGPGRAGPRSGVVRVVILVTNVRQACSPSLGVPRRAEWDGEVPRAGGEGDAGEGW